MRTMHTHRRLARHGIDPAIPEEQVEAWDCAGPASMRSAICQWDRFQEIGIPCWRSVAGPLSEPFEQAENE